MLITYAIPEDSDEPVQKRNLVKAFGYRMHFLVCAQTRERGT